MTKKYAMDFIELMERSPKPRQSGLTLVRDPGMGTLQTRAFLESAAEYVDYIKFRNVTPRLFSEELIKDKIKLNQEFNVKVFTGGIYFEIAYLQGVIDQAFEYAAEMGFDAAEISDNLVPITMEQKIDFVKRCGSKGLEVFFEWGKKYPEKPLVVEEAAEEIMSLIDAGVSRVIVEESEIDQLLGKKCEKKEAERLFQLFDKVGIDKLVLEISTQEQEVWLLQNFGRDINLGPNIAPDEVVWLEAMRRGLGRKVNYSALDKWLK